MSTNIGIIKYLALLTLVTFAYLITKIKAISTQTIRIITKNDYSKKVKIGLINRNLKQGLLIIGI